MGSYLQNRFIVDESWNEDKKLVKAIDSRNGESVALKRWDANDMRGINEIEQLNLLDHEGIPKLIAYGIEDEYRYMAYKWEEGESLEELVARRGKLNEKEIIYIINSLCNIFMYLHNRNLVFGDLKPSNVIVRASENELYVALIDFEAVRYSDNLQQTISLGSKMYSAPELMYGEMSARSDIYSLGVILLFMLVGSPHRKALMQMKSRFNGVIRACIHLDPKKRYKNVSILKNKLNAPGAETSLLHEGRIIPFPGKRQCYRRAILFVDCNICFASELAYTAAALFNLRTAVFEMSDCPGNKISYYLETKKERSMYVAETSAPGLWYDESVLFNLTLHEWESRGLIKKSKQSEFLYVGEAYFLSEAESCDKTHVRNFCAWAYNNFDLLIIADSNRLSGKVKREMMSYSDRVIAAVSSNIDEVEMCFEYYKKLASDNLLTHSKIKYVGWDYNEKYSLSDEEFKMIVGEECYLGHVSYDAERFFCLNISGSYYCEKSPARLTAQYGSILQKLVF